MAPVDIRPPGYIPQGTFSGTIPGEKGIERRRRLADVLAQRGTETTPVQHWTQGAARIANSLAGALGNYQVGQMEQQRSSALAEALRSGATPMQLFGTGDEQLMEVGKFLADQQRQKFEDERLATTTAENTRRWEADQRLQEAANRRQEAGEAREAAKPAPLTPYAAEFEKQRAQDDQARAERVKAAQMSKAKIVRLKAQIGKEEVVGQNPDGTPITKFTGNDELFGIVQSNPYYRGGQNLFGDPTGAEGRKSNLESGYAGAEIDIARMGFQGQGAVGEREREIVRRRLGGLGNPDALTAWRTLSDIEREADDVIASGGAAPPIAPPPSQGNAPEITLTRPRGPQHPIQNAPPPQPNANAGEVPRPVRAGPQQGGGGLPYVPDPANPWLTPQVWAEWGRIPGRQQQWNDAE